MKRTFKEYLESQENNLDDLYRYEIVELVEQWHAEQVKELTPIEPKTARKCLDKHSKMEKALNDAYDALRDGQSMQAKQIIGEVLGYEPRKED